VSSGEGSFSFGTVRGSIGGLSREFGCLRRGGVGGNGGRRPALEEMAGILYFFSLGSNSGRPIVNQRSGLEHTGSHGRFTKETLGFLEINPPSIAYC
jgi:hypothetical protein